MTEPIGLWRILLPFRMAHQIPRGAGKAMAVRPSRERGDTLRRQNADRHDFYAQSLPSQPAGRQRRSPDAGKGIQHAMRLNGVQQPPNQLRGKTFLVAKSAEPWHAFIALIGNEASRKSRIDGHTRGKTAMQGHPRARHGVIAKQEGSHLGERVAQETVQRVPQVPSAQMDSRPWKTCPPDPQRGFHREALDNGLAADPHCLKECDAWLGFHTGPAFGSPSLTVHIKVESTDCRPGPAPRLVKAQILWHKRFRNASGCSRSQSKTK